MLPVNGDFEDGYGNTPDDVAATVNAAVERGIAGIGIEDTTGNLNDPIRDFDDAVARVRAAVQAADGRIVVTGRTDSYPRYARTSMTLSGASPPSPRSARTSSD